jgi:hypothetical protein
MHILAFIAPRDGIGVLIVAGIRAPIRPDVAFVGIRACVVALEGLQRAPGEGDEKSTKQQGAREHGGEATLGRGEKTTRMRHRSAPEVRPRPRAAPRLPASDDARELRQVRGEQRPRAAPRLPAGDVARKLRRARGERRRAELRRARGERRRAELRLGSRRATPPRAAPRSRRATAPELRQARGERRRAPRAAPRLPASNAPARDPSRSPSPALFLGLGRFLKKMPRFAGTYYCEAIRTDTPRAV